MAWWIGTGTHVHWADYWVIVAATFRSDGSIDPGALVTPQGQHLLTVPQLIYWANIELFGGSNIALGYVVLAVVVAQIALLWRWLAELTSIPVGARAAAAAFVGVALLSPNGAWNFLRSMSGTAWLFANLFALLAIHLMARARTTGAIACATLATLTYGTGLVAWPAIASVALVRTRRWRTLVPVALAAGVVVGGYALARTSVENAPGQPTPAEVAKGVVAVVGGIVSDDLTVARTAGTIVVALVLAVGVIAVRRLRAPVNRNGVDVPAGSASALELAPWLGLALYGLGNALLIAVSRARGIGGEVAFVSSRYSSIAAIVWITLVVLAVVLGRGRRGVWMPVFALALVAPFHGLEEVRETTSRYDRLEDLANAQRVKVAGGGRWFAFLEMDSLGDTLEALGHHPFDGRHRAACGLLDDTLAAPTADLFGTVTATAYEALPLAVTVTGEVAVGEVDVDCVVLVDGDRRVVGVGRVEAVAGHPGRRRVTAYAPSGTMPLELVVRIPEQRTWRSTPVASADDPDR
jgi:hypothetical protein